MNMEKSSYYHDFKIKTPYYHPYPFLRELKLFFINKSKLRSKIINLPNEIQKKIYLKSIQNYWKNDFLEKPLKPSWCDYKAYMDNELSKCYFKNIHFLHLDCNIIPSMKEWIPGCQCDFCLNDTKESVAEKLLTINKIFDYDLVNPGTNEFYKRVHCYDIIPNYWNIYLIYWIHEDYNNIASFRVFDPVYKTDPNSFHLL
jgi:hypothetical protein